MLKKDYTELLAELPVTWKIPGGFFEAVFLREDCYCFLMNCSGNKRYFHIGTPCKELTGFHSVDFVKGGVEFWLSRVHPLDISYVTEAIIEGFSQLMGMRDGFSSPVMVRLRYRFLTANDTWLNFLETRYLFSNRNDGMVDQLLCKIELIDEAGEMNILKTISSGHRNRNQMLAAAIRIKSSEQKITETLAFQPTLTNREKEILQLIGEGLSSKMIADQFEISIHTVETHRKHLLEKLDVRNSMELIKKASKYFWL
jgi:DNA-binding CsgD family transcriptional regulator